MLASEIETLFRLWEIGTIKVFKYVRAFAPPEYVLITRVLENDFRCQDHRGTYKLSPMDKDEITSLLRSKSLIKISLTVYNDFLKLKTNGCTCGAWATSDSNLHSRICAIYREDY